MQPREVRLLETKDLLFSVKDVTYYPETPRQKESFTVKGRVELFGLPYLLPVWMIATVTYPEKWWEEIIPIWGSPEVRELDMAIGGDFEITFSRGFEREGEFGLAVRVYPGPTLPLDSIVLPPAPAVATYETTFIVSGEGPPPEEAGFRDFQIVSYSKNGGTPVTPLGVLDLNYGDRCRINLACEHRNGSVSPKIHAAIGNYGWAGFDQILNADKTFSIPASVDWEPWTGYIDISITSAIVAGIYSLYAKIMGITGGDIFTPIYEEVIRVAGGIPPSAADIKDFNIAFTKGTYNIGDKVPFTGQYDYKGIKQNGQLTISIGTGVYPTFNTVYTYSPISIPFEAATDWVTRTLSGSITLPTTLQAGQTYSVRAKLETLTDKTQETDTDWSAFDIAGAPPPTSDIRNFNLVSQGGTYDLGDSVPYSGSYEYKGKAQGGSLIISLGTGVYPTFTTKYTFPSKSVTFQESMDWRSFTLSGSFTLPSSLEPGQTYNVRARLETADGKQETDTDWGVLIIKKVYKGTINKKELEYNESRAAIPASNIPQGKRGLVHIWGRNDTSSNQTLGIGWSVTDPDGVVVEKHENDWAFGWVGAGQDREFIGGRFTFSKVGTYKLAVALYMNSSNPVEVDRYVGTLCTVSAVAVGITFNMGIWGAPDDFPLYDYWMCYYWDNGIGGFVGDQKWYRPHEKIQFTNIQSGQNGYVAVFLKKGSTISKQYTSPRWNAVNGGDYTYDVDIDYIYGA